MRKILLVLFFLGLCAVVLASGALLWGYQYITRDLPLLDSIEDYRPPSATVVYSSDGQKVAEFYEERRYPVKLRDVPLFVRNSFLAAEDANFYSHPGIDIISILRATYKNVVTGHAKQGASTITQQVVKNLLLSREKTLQRKAKEAILSYKLEKAFSKDEILEIYLNQIFFGSGAYGIKAAASVYFHKDVGDLTLAEAAILAGLPQAPSRYSPIGHLDFAKQRQRYVLDQMVKAGFISRESAQAAKAQPIRVFKTNNEKLIRAPYYTSEIRRLLIEKLGSEAEVDTGGYQVQTALDLRANGYAQAALRKGLREVDKRRGWRGAVEHVGNGEIDKFIESLKRLNGSALKNNRVYRAIITGLSRNTGLCEVSLGNFRAKIDLRSANWAKRRLHSDDSVTWIKVEDELKIGDVIEVLINPEKAEPKTALPPGLLANVELDQTPEIEGAIVLIDPNSGKVPAIVGGYSYDQSQFNRATQSLRQPGSAFKPIVYLTAIDRFGYTPATIVYDQPREFRVGDQVWAPKNYEDKYFGAVTLQTALQKSLNLVSADIISRIGIDPVIELARKMGITTPLGRNLSLSLGSSEIPLLELSRAYGVFPAKGVLFDSTLITKILDRHGQVVYDFESDRLSHARQVVDENSAFIMAHMMKGVIERGTGVVIKALGRPVAGKTGTSNDHMDTWFIGYTPRWVAGVWVGFDKKKNIGNKEAGGRTSAPIWLYLMRSFLKYDEERNYQKIYDESKAEAERLGIEFSPPEKLAPLDFSIPDGVDPFWVDKDSGLLSNSSDKNAILEYFKRGTEPSKTTNDERTTEDYLNSPEL